MKPIKVNVSKTFLYKHCSNEWHSIIEKNQELFSIGAGKNIITEGEVVKNIFFILKGKVKVISTYGNQKERVLRLATDGQILGHRGFHAKKYPITAIALTDTELMAFPVSVFRNLIRTNPNLSLAFIDFLSEELRESEGNMKQLLAAEIKNRVAIILLKLVHVFGYESKSSNKLSFTLSRTDISNMAGTTYETVVRSLVFLQEKKIIKIEGKAIRIVDEAALVKMAH